LELSKNNLNSSNTNLNSNSKVKSNSKSKLKSQGVKLENEVVERQDRQELDQKLLTQLNKHIKEDSSYFTEQAKKINKSVTSSNSGENTNYEFQEDKNEKENESENIFDGVLVKRPPKGFVWGMGNQANKKKCKELNFILFLPFSNFTSY